MGSFISLLFSIGFWGHLACLLFLQPLWFVARQTGDKNEMVSEFSVIICLSILLSSSPLGVWPVTFVFFWLLLLVLLLTTTFGYFFLLFFPVGLLEAPSEES